MGESITGLKRSHMCCHVNETMIGQEVTVMGWVQRRRDLGQLIFIALRDRTGLVQIAIDGNTAPKEIFEKAETVRSEYTLAVRGIVTARTEGNINPNMKTGKIEIIASELRILSESETTPFQIEDNITVKDDLRLKYRYLDLRRPCQLKNIVLRHQVVQALRSFLNNEGFLEIETPILGKSTPEGARDYLVPSRVHPGNFYGLPQSPQLYKQLLMVSGMDRYYQIAKFFTPEKLQEIVDKMEGKPGDLILICADKDKVVFDSLGALRLELSKMLELTRPDDFRFLWITEFPMLEWDEEENRYVAVHHPFTAPMDEDLELLDTDPGAVRAKAYDIVLNGYELGGGSIRIHRRDIQQKMFELLGFTQEDAQERFGFLLDAFKYGVPPHGGLAFGLDRIIMLMSNAPSIRDVIAFPKVKDASCPMTDAPNVVDQKQLDELAICFNEEILKAAAAETEEA